MDDLRPIVVPETALYRVRWYLLALYSLTGTSQVIVMNGYGPITRVLKTLSTEVWTDSQIELLGSWFSVTFAIFFWPSSLAMQRYGLRFIVVGGCFLTALGAGLRCVTTDPSTFLGMCHVCGFVNGISCVAQMVIVPAFSARWFPPEQRTISTSVLLGTGGLGFAASFTVPQLVVSADAVHDDPVAAMHAIRKLMIIFFVPALVLFIATAVYFPESPPKPPSLSASERKIIGIASAKAMLRQPLAWKILLLFGLAYGPLGGFSFVVNVDWGRLGISEKTVNAFAGFTVIGNDVGVVLISFILGRFVRKLKTVALGLLTASSLSFAWFLFAYLNVIHPTEAHFLAGWGLAAFFLALSYPSLIEMAIEALYPVEESTVTAFVAGTASILATLYVTLAAALGASSTAWMNFAIPASVMLTVPLLASMKMDYKRVRVDEDGKNSVGGFGEPVSEL